MSQNSLKLKEEEAEKLISDLKRRSKILKPGDYEKFRAELFGKKIIVYDSNKVVYEIDNDVIEFLKDSLKKESGYDFLIGSDEAGKGEKQGPLVVAAVKLTPKQALDLKVDGVMDSKSLDLKRLRVLAEKIRGKAEDYEILCLMPDKYNQIYSELGNLNLLLERAHKQVITAVLDRKEDVKITVDKFMDRKFEIGDLEIRAKHDAEIETEVAAASILAKLEYEENKNSGEKEHFKG